MVTEATALAQNTASNLPADVLRDIVSIEDAQRALENAGVIARHISDEMGDGFSLVDDKEPLVGTPFIIISSTISDGDYGKMCTLRVLTRDGRKLIVNDGSTGICAQAQEYAASHDDATLAGIIVEKGLRASRFRYCSECRHVSKLNASECANCGADDVKAFAPATTYYLDTSAAS